MNFKFQVPSSKSGRRRGSALLLALLITSVTLAVTINVAAIINVGLGGATASRDAVAVFYRAESGLERALFRVRHLKIPAGSLNMGTECDTDLFCGLDSFGQPIDCIPSCSVSPTYKPGLLSKPLTLKQDQTLEVDLLDTASGANVAAGVDTLQVRCVDLLGAPAGSIVVTATQVAAGTWGVTVGAVQQQIYQCPLSSPDTWSFPGLGLQTGNSYLIKIRAVRSDVRIDFVKALGPGGEKALSDRLELTSTAGTFLARQQLTAAMPGRVHLSGLFDYVLYSECGIFKAVAGQPCPAP